MPRARATAAKKAAPKRAPKKVAKAAKKAAPKKKWSASASFNRNSSDCVTAWTASTFFAH